MTRSKCGAAEGLRPFRTIVDKPMAPGKKEEEMRQRARHDRKQKRPTVKPTPLPGNPRPFKSHGALLDAAKKMFEARQAADVGRNRGKSGQPTAPGLRRAYTAYWHKSLDLTGDKLPLCAQIGKLSRLEREIVAAILLNYTGFLGTDVYRCSCSALRNLIGVSGRSIIGFLRALSERGKLHKTGLICFDDSEEEDPNRRLALPDQALIDMVLRNRPASKGISPVRTEKSLYRWLGKLTRVCGQKAQAISDAPCYRRARGVAARSSSKAAQLFRELIEALKTHPKWMLNRLLDYKKERVCAGERLILLILLGKELGYLPADDYLFTGIGLAHALSDVPEDDFDNKFKLLSPGAFLIREELIQPCGGGNELFTGNMRIVSLTEFELAEKSLGILELDRRKRDPGSVRAREAKLKMDQIVLSEKVSDALKMAIAHTRNSEVLMREWGMAEVVPYGRSVTLLFSGPPGTGKTACAEALAHELGLPILVADYSAIQSCLVGGTEKNVVKTFRQARTAGAVLFWDEADAMFADRDSAYHHWEVRDVNVLLQELEGFEGVCILATNRKISLDKALERRIAMKVEFDRPDHEMRRRIWERLIPKKMPLAGDVDVEGLAEADLTGGEIKNAVLNAARIALARDGERVVQMRDFEKAIGMEKKGGWSEMSKGRIGFAK